MSGIERKEKLKKTRVFTLGDIIVTAVALVVSLVALIPLFWGGEQGKTVVVSVNGVESEYSLSVNQQIDLGTMVLVIENGEVFVKETTCPSKVCYHTGKISQVNQKIVCLPHSIVITVVGESEFNADTGGGGV